MKQSTKLVLDLLMGAVIPILILNYLTGRLGAPLAYLCAALVPVGWVFLDLLVITRRFNFITSYVGFSAMVNGVLAFWFVDGLLFAIKDSAGLLITTLLFGGSALLARPVVRYFFIQAVNPDTSEKQQALDDLLAERRVRRALVVGTLIVAVQSALACVANIYLNLVTVVSPFGIEAFNQQVAQVNWITRLLFPIPAILAYGSAIWLIYREVFRLLPTEPGKTQIESDFWELVRLREEGIS